MLTEPQKNFFDTFGYLVFPGLLADIIGEVTDAFEVVWEEHGGGVNDDPKYGHAGSGIVPLIDQHERLCALLDDPRIHDLFCSLLGDDFNYLGSYGNCHAGESHWHSDSFQDVVRTVKIVLYLDPLTLDSGALRFIPGSHMIGDRFATALQDNSASRIEEFLGIAADEVPAVALETVPGDLAVFNLNTKHGSFGGTTWRRILTINASERYPCDQTEVLREWICAFAKWSLDSIYGEKMLATADTERMRHLEQVLANQDHLPALSAKARQEKAESSRG